MKKISNFIVQKRNFIIPIFIILAIICVFTSQKVKINKDITEYLPSDSKTRSVINTKFEPEANNTFEY